MIRILFFTSEKVKDSIHVYHQYVIRVNNRDELQKQLKEDGISTAVYYPRPLHLQECYKRLCYKESLPVAEKACKRWWLYLLILDKTYQKECELNN